MVINRTSAVAVRIHAVFAPLRSSANAVAGIVAKRTARALTVRVLKRDNINFPCTGTKKVL
jgi:hypothetical protein